MAHWNRSLLVGGTALALLLNIGIWSAVFIHKDERTLRVSFLNVGQGDSIFIQGPTGIQVLVDGGPDKSVLRELSKEMSPLDRSIDLLVETHPDSDHITGLAGVLEQYSVSYFLTSDIAHDTSIDAQVDADVAAEPGITKIVARRGQRIHLGGGAYADVLYPDKDVSHIKATNDGSVVLHVVYGNTSFMLTGDLPSTYEDHLVQTDATTGNLGSTVLKAGHHGSKYSTDALWLAAVHPQMVVISAGKNNTYGHPSPEVLTRIQKEGAQILSTIDLGTINFVSDGNTVTRK